MSETRPFTFETADGKTVTQQSGMVHKRSQVRREELDELTEKRMDLAGMDDKMKCDYRKYVKGVWCGSCGMMTPQEYYDNMNEFSK